MGQDPTAVADRICAEIRERARRLTTHARVLASTGAGPAVRARAQRMEVEAEAVSTLAEDLVRTTAGLAASSRASPVPLADAGTHSSGPPRLLVASQDPFLRESVLPTLRPDHLLTVVPDGEHALAAIHMEPPDLIVVDQHLPALDGIRLLDALQEEPLPSEIPVIVLACEEDDSTRVRALERGAADVIRKPVSSHELRARIDRALRLSQHQAHLRAIARTDALSGLANLRAFRERLDDEIHRSRRYGTPLACVMADMDNLKKLNDELGHAAGDRAIATVASVLRSELRSTDLAARYGGDEFVLLLPHTSAADARQLAQRLCEQLAATELREGDVRVQLPASFGVAEAGPQDRDDDGPALVRRADAALYAAKRDGRGCVRVDGRHRGG